MRPKVDWKLIGYNMALAGLSPLVAGYLGWRLVVKGKSREGWRDRLGRPATPALRIEYPDEQRIWLHAVSVGEVAATLPIMEAIAQIDPLSSMIVSTTTPTGNLMAHKLCKRAEAIIYFPFECAPAINGAFQRVRPNLCLLVEGELWPNFLALGQERGSKMMVVNGRITDGNFRRARMIRPLFSWMLGYVDRFCMQSQVDAERIIYLGADPGRVSVVGNTKFDQAIASLSPEEEFELRDQLGLSRREIVMVAGSTHPGEEEIVLDAFWRIKLKHPEARLIIAPRHIQRTPAIEQLIAQRGFVSIRRTQLRERRAAGSDISREPIIILDTIGELEVIYCLATVTFVGGSLVPIGGHNVLQPAAQGKPVWFGPHMNAARDISEVVTRFGVGFSVKNADQLVAGVLDFLEDSSRQREIESRSRQMFQENRGASQRCAQMAMELLE